MESLEGLWVWLWVLVGVSFNSVLVRTVVWQVLCMPVYHSSVFVLFISQVISGLVRYMRHDHRRDFIDACLSAIKSEKIPGIPSLLDKRHKATVDLHRKTYSQGVRCCDICFSCQ